MQRTFCVISGHVTPQPGRCAAPLWNCPKSRGRPTHHYLASRILGRRRAPITRTARPLGRTGMGVCRSPARRTRPVRPHPPSHWHRPLPNSAIERTRDPPTTPTARPTDSRPNTEDTGLSSRPPADHRRDCVQLTKRHNAFGRDDEQDQFYNTKQIKPTAPGTAAPCPSHQPSAMMDLVIPSMRSRRIVDVGK
jgi:hypothetical protein